MSKHTAIYISNKENKRQLIDDITTGIIHYDFKDLKGALFSEITINKHIEEEKRHGNFQVLTETKNSLEKSSSGERRKALLHHIISKNPDYIIVDDIFGNLDISSQKTIVKTLSELSEKIPIIQITNRKSDILEFIENVYKLQDNKLVIVNSVDAFNKKIGKVKFIESLPLPCHDIDPDIFNPIVKFDNVTITYGDRTIIKNISWEIKKGEFWQLIGPNGSGKSTLLTLISGDNPKAYNQNITLFGIKKGSGESVWDIKKNIGYFSSELSRGFKRLDTIEKMILSGFFDSIGLYKYPSERQIAITHQWLRLLGMYHKKDKSFLSLSTGHQRLVLVARALVKHPPLLILDEPTNGLDDDDAQLFSALINKVALESDTAILYVSHRKAEGLLNPDCIFQLNPEEMGSTGKKVIP